MSNPTEAEIEQFLKEWNAGLHTLSAEDEAALAKAKPAFLEKLRTRIYGTADEQSFSE